MLTIAILAGGKSERIGGDKALLPLAGKPLIEHLLGRISGIGDELLICTNQPEQLAYLGIRTVPDLLPSYGSIIGLHSALSAAKNMHVLVLGCDMPFVNTQLLTYLADLAPKADVIVPFVKGEYEPLHAVYSRNCIEAIEVSLRLKQNRISGLYDKVSVHTVGETEISSFDPSGISFFNINTRKDLSRAEEIIGMVDE